MTFQQRLAGRLQNVAACSREKIWRISGCGCRIPSGVVRITGGGQVIGISKL